MSAHPGSVEKSKTAIIESHLRKHASTRTEQTKNKHYNKVRCFTISQISGVLVPNLFASAPSGFMTDRMRCNLHGNYCDAKAILCHLDRAVRSLTSKESAGIGLAVECWSNQGRAYLCERVGPSMLWNVLRLTRHKTTSRTVPVADPTVCDMAGCDRVVVPISDSWIASIAHSQLDHARTQHSVS